MMDKLHPKVSIVLPTYNGAKYIKQSIDSCLNQTYKNIELIIVDDHSTDETPKIIKSYKDKRILYIRHEKNKGLPNALNTGFANATGEFLTWTSDDNFYGKKAIEKMLSFLRKKKCSFVYCDFYRINEQNQSNPKLVKLPDVHALDKFNVVGACFLYSSIVKEKIGDYDPKTVLAEDYDYWIRVSKRFSMCHLNEPLYFHRRHEKSLYSRFSRSYDIKITRFLVQIKNNCLEAEQGTELFINSILAEKIRLDKYCTTRIAIRFFKRTIFKRIEFSKPYITYIRLRFSKEINQINTVIRDFQTGKIDFENAKINIKNII